MSVASGAEIAAALTQVVGPTPRPRPWDEALEAGMDWHAAREPIPGADEDHGGYEADRMADRYERWLGL